MSGIHPLDLAIVAVYLGVVVYLAQRAAAASRNEEGFFLAHRRFGRLLQFFLNFGNSTDANTAVSTVSLVYRQGAAGAWLPLQMVFVSPYYWFMNLWFRRARLVTTAEIFESRLGSRALAWFYAVFQIGVTVILIGFGNFIVYKITAALVPKPAAALTVPEQQQLAGYREWRELEFAAATGPLTPDRQTRLAGLRDLAAHGELRSTIPQFPPLPFYVAYTAFIGLYIALGGLAATALNHVFQSGLILAFSIMLLPFGLHALGGAGALHASVPPPMFNLVGASGGDQFTWPVVLAFLLASLVQINGNIVNMGLGGSARNEFAARFGAVAGTYGKRLMIVLWAFVGLIAIGLCQGAAQLSDPDAAWGTLSRQLLGPGFLGLMLAGLLAANMSATAMKMMAISALAVRNIFRPLAPAAGEKHAVLAGRVAIAVLLLLSVVAAHAMEKAVEVLKLILTVNLPFGAAVLLMFFWRRLTAAAVWWCVALTFSVTIAVPFGVPRLPALASHPALTVFTQPAGPGAANPAPMFFEAVAHRNPADLASPLVGRGRFNLEAWLLARAGLDFSRAAPSELLAARFFFDAAFPFAVLILVSLLTRPPPREITAQFLGRMKTPIGATAELDAAAVEETRRHPPRFDHLKLFPNSAWEFTKWNREDTLGFLACCAVSAAIVALFWLGLQVVR